MDPRERADALLARAKARGAFVVTPDSATSPMDSANTQRVPRAAITELDQDPDTTTQLPASLIEENDHPLAGSAPTRRLETPSSQRRRPQPQPPKPAPKPQAAPLARRPQAEPITSPLKAAEPELPGPEDTGLVPTVTQSNGKSDLSRRLDGI